MTERTSVTTLFRRAFEAGERRALTVVQQAAFAVFLAFADLMLLAYRDDTHPWLMLTGFGLLVVATTLSIAEPHLPERLHIDDVVVALNFFAVGASRASTLPDGAALSLLVFFPATWLILSHGRRGLAVAIGLIIVTISVPTLTFGSIVDFPQIVLVCMLPFATLMIGALMIGIDGRLRRALADQERLAKMANHSAELLNSTLNSMDVAVNVLDAEGGTILRNAAAEEIVESQTRGVRTQAGSIILSIDGYHADGVTPFLPAENPIRKAMAGTTTHNELVLLGDPGDDQRAISLSAYPLSGPGPLDGHVMIFASDVTEMQALLRQRDDFISTVSHELRTPLTSILGYADLATEEFHALQGGRAELAGSPLGDYLDVIERNSEQLLGLVEDLLLERQAQAGRLMLTRSKFSLDSLAKQIAESMQPALRRRDMHIEVSADDRVVIDADQRRIAQVLDNLVMNAIKYGNDGGNVAIEVTAHDGVAEVTVIDNGPGMTPRELSQLFVPFFRGTTARASSQRGTGLGLTVVRRILDAHCGTITAESEPGCGTTMRIRIPHEPPLEPPLVSPHESHPRTESAE
jgi:signal transduction histidine kinase